MQKAAENAAQAASEDAAVFWPGIVFALALFSICSSIRFKNIPGIRLVIPDREGC
jgi:hypothetical protein